MGEVFVFEFGVYGGSFLRFLVFDFYFVMYLFKRDNQYILIVLLLDLLIILCILIFVYVIVFEMNEYYRNVLSLGFNFFGVVGKILGISRGWNKF